MSWVFGWAVFLVTIIVTSSVAGKLWRYVALTWRLGVRGRAWVLLFFSLLLGSLSVLVGYTVSWVVFGIDVEGHLKRAADANQPALAIEELDTALGAMSERDLCNDPTAGEQYTSVIYQTPDEDVCFWRRNIEETRADLAALPPEAAPLEVSNLLLKVRETLLDRGAKVTAPPGAGWYPFNRLLAVLFWLPLLLVPLLLLTPDSWLVDREEEPGPDEDED